MQRRIVTRSRLIALFCGLSAAALVGTPSAGAAPAATRGPSGVTWGSVTPAGVTWGSVSPAGVTWSGVTWG